MINYWRVYNSGEIKKIQFPTIEEAEAQLDVDRIYRFGTAVIIDGEPRTNGYLALSRVEEFAKQQIGAIA